MEQSHANQVSKLLAQNIASAMAEFDDGVVDIERLTAINTVCQLNALPIIAVQLARMNDMLDRLVGEES